MKQGQDFGDSKVSEALELRYIAVAPENMAQPRWVKSHGPSGTQVALVLSVDEEVELDICRTVKEEAQLSHASLCFLGGKESPAHAATPSCTVIPLLNKTHLLC